MQQGDKVYLVPRESSNAYRRDKNPREATIIRIGNKYYYAKMDYGSEYKINKKTNVVDNGIYSSEFDAFFDLKTIEEKQQAKDMLEVIRKKIGNYGGTSLTNDQIKQIFDILTKQKDESLF